MTEQASAIFFNKGLIEFHFVPSPCEPTHPPTSLIVTASSDILPLPDRQAARLDRSPRFARWDARQTAR